MDEATASIDEYTD